MLKEFHVVEKLLVLAFSGMILATDELISVVWVSCLTEITPRSSTMARNTPEKANTNNIITTWPCKQCILGIQPSDYAKGV